MIKIAYIPTSNYSKNIGYDLRNIILYSKLNKVKINIFKENQNYDYLLLPPTFDISNIDWLKKRKEKIIYQLVDDYLSENNLNIKNILRGTYKYLKNENNNIFFNYKKNLEEICRLSHAIICSSNEQKNKFSKIIENVHIFLREILKILIVKIILKPIKLLKLFGREDVKIFQH